MQIRQNKPVWCHHFYQVDERQFTISNGLPATPSMSPLVTYGTSEMATQLFSSRVFCSVLEVHICAPDLACNSTSCCVESIDAFYHSTTGNWADPVGLERAVDDCQCRVPHDLALWFLNRFARALGSTAQSRNEETYAGRLI